MMKVQNPYLEQSGDYWYHLGLAPTAQVKAIFHDVKFVCLGGKNKRMENFAKYLYQALDEPQNSFFENGSKRLFNISGSAGRYCMYKVGNCISASHGMGMPSFQILLHELFKLLTFAGCEDVAFIRIGTSGGLGLEPGTTVVTKQPYSSLLKPYFTQVACGCEVKYESTCDEQLASQLLECGKKLGTKITTGNTMSCDDFYEGQGRLDGALCSFTPTTKMDFLERAHKDHGILNIEMESNVFGAMCKRFGVKGTTVCVTLLDRLQGDLVNTPKLAEWELQPQAVVAELIKSSLHEKVILN